MLWCLRVVMMSDIPIHRPEHTGLYIFLPSQSPYRAFPTPLDTRWSLLLNAVAKRSGLPCYRSIPGCRCLTFEKSYDVLCSATSTAYTRSRDRLVCVVMACFEVRIYCDRFGLWVLRSRCFGICSACSAPPELLPAVHDAQ